MPRSSPLPMTSGRISLRPDPQPHQQKTAVLIDGSALFLGARSLYESQLDYRRLYPVLKSRLPWLGEAAENSDDLWVMWTSASTDNAPQARFLDFAHRELNWEVRPTSPADAYLVDPTMLSSLSPDHPIRSKLLRFDSAIAFALGRLSSIGYRCLVVSPSFQLADSLRLLAGTAAIAPAVAFFGHGLDPRMQQFLVGRDCPVDFVDLSDFADELFSTPPIKKGNPTTTARNLVF